MASIDLLSRALRATRDREPYLSERLALINVVKEGSSDGHNDMRATTAAHPGRRRRDDTLPSINKIKASPLRVKTAAGQGRNGRWLRNRAMRSRGAWRSSPPRAIVRQRMHKIESTSPYNPKVMLARALSESRGTLFGSDYTEGNPPMQSHSSDPQLSLSTSQAALLKRQQRLIDKHGVDLWDRITEGHSVSDAVRMDQLDREDRARRLRRRARGEMLAETMQKELSQLLEKQLSKSSSAPIHHGEEKVGSAAHEAILQQEILSQRPHDKIASRPLPTAVRAYRSPPWANENSKTSNRLRNEPNIAQMPPASPLTLQHAFQKRQQRKLPQHHYGTPPSKSWGHQKKGRNITRPFTTEAKDSTPKQILELTDRVRMLELELAESKEAKRVRAQKRKRRARRAAKRRIAKREAQKRKEFVRLAPFKSAATSAAAAVAGALAAAAAAEGLERSIGAVENLAMESGGEIPDDIALVLSKELDRASRRAAKTIDAASAAVSVTSAAVEASRSSAEKAVEKGGTWETKQKLEQ